MAENSEVKKLSIGEKVKYFFINPGVVFAEYIQKPTFLIKFLIIALGVILFGYAESTQKALLIQKAVEKLNDYHYSKEVFDLAKQNIEKGTSFSAVSLIGGGVFGTAAAIAIVSFIYWFLTRLFAGQNSYKDTVAVYSLAYLPQAIYSILLSIYIIAAHSIPFLSLQNSSSNLSILLGVVNPIKIWQIVLLIIGLAKVGDISKKKAAIIVIGLTLVSLAFTFGTAAIGKGIIDGMPK